MADSKQIFLGVSGGVAAYKAVEVASRLRKAGHVVQVAMTEAATRFVSPLTFAAVSGRAVLESLFPRESAPDLRGLYPHLYPAMEVDAFVAAPATADLIAQLALGLGRDPVTASALSLRPDCLRLFAPAMNVEMWEQPVVRRRVAELETLGWTRVGPACGHLACGLTGTGRMAEPEEIVTALESAWAGAARLAGRRVLILSGPTREHLDPIRYLGNPSSGKMGRRLAEEALRLGAQVDFITGPVAEENLPHGRQLSLTRITRAEEMLAAATAPYETADLVIFAAAVADYAPVEPQGDKLPKATGEINLRIRPTPDVAATLNQRKRPGQVTIGFALQTSDGPRQAADKRDRKGFDAIVLNFPEALGQDGAAYTFLTAAGAEDWGRLDKSACARRILLHAADRLDAPRK
jgi:phosphopantothenoylcysteine decarboxylase/phosphopantothenate--cysteine ligase